MVIQTLGSREGRSDALGVETATVSSPLLGVILADSPLLLIISSCLQINTDYSERLLIANLVTSPVGFVDNCSGVRGKRHSVETQKLEKKIFLHKSSLAWKYKEIAAYHHRCFLAAASTWSLCCWLWTECPIATSRLLKEWMSTVEGLKSLRSESLRGC